MAQPIAKEEMQERAQLVRIHEANCELEHPTEQELAFRMSIMKKIALSFGLKELRGVEIFGPSPRTGETGGRK